MRTALLVLRISLTLEKSDVEKLLGDINALLESGNLTDSETDIVDSLRKTAEELAGRIASAGASAKRFEIIDVEDITDDNVKLEDKDRLEKAELLLEEALRDFGGNYTEKERKDLKARLETVKSALSAISNAEKAADESSKLPSVDDVKLGDKSEVDRIKNIINGLTENEKNMLGKDTVDRLNALTEKIQKLESGSGQVSSPKTGRTDIITLLIALMFVSGGVATGVSVVSKKKKRSVK